jgi:hypothetical protein
MRALAFCLTVGLATAAGAARQHNPADRPSEVLVVADTASVAAELDAWREAMVKLQPGAALPATDELLPRLLGRLLGATRLDGIDPRKGFHALLLDPQKFPQPLVLSVPVRNLPALMASVKDSGLVVQAKNGRAVIGAQPAVDRVLEFVRGLPAPAPEHGLRATVFVPEVWAAYGAQLTVGKAAIVAQAAQSPGQMLSPQTLGAMLDRLIAGVEQSERLGVDLRAERGQLELALTLDVKAGGTLDGIFSSQKPTAFASVRRLSRQAASFVAGGTLDLTLFQSWISDFLGGAASASDAQALKAMLDEFGRVFTGELAMAGDMQSTGRVNMQYVADVRDSQRATELFSRWYALFSRMGTVSKAKVTEKLLPPTQYDGLTLSWAQLEYDFSNVPGYKGPTHLSGTSAWAGFDKLLVMSVNTTGGADTIRALVDSARRGKDAFQLDGAVGAAFERARAAKETFCMWMDLSKLTATMASPARPGMAVAVGLGFAPRSGRLRLTLTTP